MPKLLAALLVSVDGRTSGTRSPGYFGYFWPDLDRWIRDEMSQRRRHLMARKTHETLASLPVGHRDASWELTTCTPTTIFSRTLTAPGWPGGEICAQDAVEHLRRLKRAEGSDLRTIGSPSLAQQLLDARLVDHLDSWSSHSCWARADSSGAPPVYVTARIARRER
jgi:dihydrofolate reductase